MRIIDKICNERGAALAFVAISMAVLLGGAGLALDSGRAYLIKAELSRAADAGVLAGARSLREGNTTARQRAIDVALLNGARIGERASLDVSFGFTAEGERTVRVDAARVMPTLLMPVLGVDSVNIRSSAVAAIPPVDLVLLLDTSGSLGSAFDDLQNASRTFVDQFDDNLDQVSLVSFQLRAATRVGLTQPFKGQVKNQIGLMKSDGDTNMGEGLRLAHAELKGGAERERSAKVVVFFTDGRATAFRGNLLGIDRMMAVGRTSTSNLRGYWDFPDLLPIDGLIDANGCAGKGNCFGWTPNSVRDRARESGLEQAEALRADGIVVYSIGLGNPKAGDPLEVPDMDYLREIANENGSTDSRQPRGKAYFAPTEAELEAVFRQVATDLLVRLAQ